MDFSSLKTGTYTLPGLSIPSDSGTFKTQPLKLRVVAADSRESSGISDYAFIRLITSKDTAFVGEPIPIEIQLFLQTYSNKNLKLLNQKLSKYNFIN